MRRANSTCVSPRRRRTPAGEPPHVAHRLGVVVARLAGDVLLAGRIQHLVIDPPPGKALRAVRINRQPCFCSYSRTSLRLAFRAEMMRIVEHRMV